MSAQHPSIFVYTPKSGSKLTIPSHMKPTRSSSALEHSPEVSISNVYGASMSPLALTASNGSHFLLGFMPKVSFASARGPIGNLLRGMSDTLGWVFEDDRGTLSVYLPIRSLLRKEERDTHLLALTEVTRTFCSRTKKLSEGCLPAPSWLGGIGSCPSFTSLSLCEFDGAMKRVPLIEGIETLDTFELKTVTVRKVTHDDTGKLVDKGRVELWATREGKSEIFLLASPWRLDDSIHHEEMAPPPEYKWFVLESKRSVPEEKCRNPIPREIEAVGAFSHLRLTIDVAESEAWAANRIRDGIYQAQDWPGNWVSSFPSSLCLTEEERNERARKWAEACTNLASPRDPMQQHKDGLPVEVEILVDADPEGTLPCLVSGVKVAEALAKAGVKATVDKIPFMDRLGYYHAPGAFKDENGVPVSLDIYVNRR